MADCSNTPTPESTANFDLDSRCFSEAMTSNADYTTAKASDGNVKKTFAAALREAGWEHVGEWSTNPEVTESNQVIPYAGTNQLFRPLSLPYQVDSATNPNPNALLPDPATGYTGELVDVSKYISEDQLQDYTYIVYDTVEDMKKGITLGGVDAAIKDGSVAITIGYHEQGDGGGAPYVFKLGNHGDGFVNHNVGPFTAEIITNGELWDKQAGVKVDGSGDQKAALDAFFQYIRDRSPDNRIVGGLVPRFTPFGTIRKSGTLNLIDFRVEVDFCNTTFEQIDAVDSIWYEANQAGLSNLIITYEASGLSQNEILINKPVGILLSGGQPIAITSESVFTSLSQIWVYGAYDSFGLSSKDSSGGLVWQFVQSQCYSIRHYNYAFNLQSVTQVSTTTTIENCHAGCKWASKVTHNGDVYVALQHHTSSSSNEPGTAGGNAFWRLDNQDTATDAWAVGNAYRTYGKGYNINNIQTLVMDNCSMDGGDNTISGNVVNTLNSYIDINTFHLEGHTICNTSQTSFEIGSDTNIGEIYLYDQRVRLPSSSSTGTLVGGRSGRVRYFEMNGVRNHTQNSKSKGVLMMFDGGGSGGSFFTVSLGGGVSSFTGLPKRSTAARLNPLMNQLYVNQNTDTTIATLSNISNGTASRIDVDISAVEQSAKYASVVRRYTFVVYKSSSGSITFSNINDVNDYSFDISNANYEINPSLVRKVVNDELEISLNLTSSGNIEWSQCIAGVKVEVIKTQQLDSSSIVG